ncbi:PREDICTED: uncharacterized protein LOC105108282 [Populus euphratica]|uniref:RNA-directed DNA polymerase n=1 Tax=Populus euphratica TaxID=75702 RepID=A0AAJ6SYC1_POPEU|nr:PREDICTED: uncharacterized protein LOC105108282 [Populus euphratica]
MEIKNTVDDAIPEISFHALAGTTHPQTFRVIGKVGNKDLTVLIDGGSTHNFIDQAVATKLGLPVIRDKVFRVTVGNKEIIECTRRCIGLLLNIQGLSIQADFYVLPVAACQAVLGVQWLETLGPIETDYKQLSMSFCQAGKSHTIRGLQRFKLAPMTEKELLHHLGPRFFLHVMSTTTQPEPTTHISADLQRLLTEFDHLFKEPSRLPPLRSHDHHISLLPNQPPGVAVDPNKINSVQQWPVPTSAKGVRGFLGFAGYYRKFVRDFGSIAASLTQLLTKDGFWWTTESQEAFVKLKTTLVTPLVLRLPDFQKPFVVECDASGTGLGAILSQNDQPIAFFSEALKGSARALSTYDKEMLAVVKAVRKWRPYLLGKPFVIKTDHQSLKYLLEQRILTPSQARWLPKLMGYDYTILYKRGRDNQGPDALSRVNLLQFQALTLPSADWWPSLQQEVIDNPYYATLSKNASSNCFGRDGVWMENGKVHLSPNSSLLPAVLADAHSSPTSRVAAALAIPDRIWTDISMDFIDELPSSQNHDTIMVVVDRLSKLAHLVPLKHPYTTLSVAKAFISNIVRLHGMPLSIGSDRDRIFLSNFWWSLFQLHDTALCYNSSYHPQSDGQTEVINRILEQYLRCYTYDNPKKWLEWLSWAEFSYNTSVHSSTKITPFEAVYDVPPPSMILYIPGTTKVQAVDDMLRSRDEILRDLRKNFVATQVRMKCQADRHRQEVFFEVGDYVYLRLQLYRQKSVAFRSSLKLSPRFFGPFKILARVGTVAYKLDLPIGAQIHNVFHVSLLRKHVGPLDLPIVSLPPVSADVQILPEPKVILDRRVVQKGKYRLKTEVLVQWKGASHEDVTWENLWGFSKTYPDFRLEDKDAPRVGE